MKADSLKNLTTDAILKKFDQRAIQKEPEFRFEKSLLGKASKQEAVIDQLKSNGAIYALVEHKAHGLGQIDLSDKSSDFIYEGFAALSKPDNIDNIAANSNLADFIKDLVGLARRVDIDGKVKRETIDKSIKLQKTLVDQEIGDSGLLASKFMKLSLRLSVATDDRELQSNLETKAIEKLEAASISPAQFARLHLMSSFNFGNKSETEMNKQFIVGLQQFLKDKD